MKIWRKIFCLASHKVPFPGKWGHLSLPFCKSAVLFWADVTVCIRFVTEATVARRSLSTPQRRMGLDETPSGKDKMTSRSSSASGYLPSHRKQKQRSKSMSILPKSSKNQNRKPQIHSGIEKQRNYNDVSALCEIQSYPNFILHLILMGWNLTLLLVQVLI